MSVYSTLDGRAILDPAAFARFCETRSMNWCAAGSQASSRGSGDITIDADGDRIMLDAAEQMIRNLRLVADLQKAALAGQVDGAFMIDCTDGSTGLEAVVIRNSETWVGHSDCLNMPVDIGPATTRRIELGSGNHIDMVQRVGGIDTTLRVSRHAPLETCDCEGYDEAIGEAVCRNDGKLVADDGVPVVDIATFMPDRATGQLEQALITAAGAVNTDGQLAIGWLAWNATGPGQQHLFRRWLETFPEATGDRHVTWVPDLFGNTTRNFGYGTAYDKRPVCANPGGTQRGPCPAFMPCRIATSDTVRVPAHVGNADLANAAILVVGGAEPDEAVAVIAAITHPDRT